MSEINNEVFESPKVKKKRKPMSPEAKEALIARLAAGREAKKNKKKEQEKKKYIIDTKPVPKQPEPEPEPEPEPQAKQVEPKPKQPDNSLEMKALQDQINSMKLERLEDLEKKNEKKRAAIEKRRATMNRKAIERAKKNEVAKPAPIRKPVEKMEVIEEQPEQESRKMSINDDDLDIPKKKPRYSTFKRSVWSSF